MTPDVRVAALSIALLASPAFAQAPDDQPGADWLDGHVSALFDIFPDVSPSNGHQSVTEMRVRVFAERRLEWRGRLHVNLAGYVDALVADRDALGAPPPTRAAIVRPGDLYVEWREKYFDIRAGASRLVWGRLDEFQPSDVVNPIDLSRFLFEGRSEARLPVGLVRGRAFLPASVTLEGVLVPFFRAGTFDQLAEESSPFNIGLARAAACPAGPARCITLVPLRWEPPRSLEHMQGGARVTASIGRFDIGGSVYRGFEPFPLFTLGPQLPSLVAEPVFAVLEEFPRFTMLATDFETVRGPWGFRGEAAYFPQDTLQSLAPLTRVAGRTLDVGFGGDRRAGDYRISGNVIVTRRRVRDAPDELRPGTFDPAVEDTDVLVVGWAERAFARDTRQLRLLGAYNPNARSAFVRGIAAFNLRDNVWLEVSVGWLQGDRFDLLSRLAMRDFVYTRLRVHF